MKFSKTALFYIIFFVVTIIISIILSCILANVLSLVYSENPQSIMTLNPEIMVNRLFNDKAVNEMFWIILGMFLLLIIVTRFHRWFGLKDYKSKLYKVTDDIQIPQRVGNKQTQQGSSWWLSKKDYKKVFDINTIDTENETIKKLLYNADQETNAIKKITIPYKIIEDNKIVDEEKLKEEIKREYSKIKTKEIKEEKQKVFKKGGIVLGREERTVLSKCSTFPFFKTRKVEDIYFVGDNVHTLTVGATRSGKTRCLVIESIYNCGLAGESMIISDPKGELFEYTSGGLKQLGYNVVTLDFKNPMKSSCYNFLQPVINEIKKGNIAQAQQRASDICESLVEDSKQEKIWSNGEKATIKSAIMSVCMEAPPRMPKHSKCILFSI